MEKLAGEWKGWLARGKQKTTLRSQPYVTHSRKVGKGNQSPSQPAVTHSPVRAKTTTAPPTFGTQIVICVTQTPA